MKLFPESAYIQLEFNKVKDLLANYCQTEYARSKALQLRIHTKIEFIETELKQSNEYRQLIQNSIYLPNDYILDLARELKLLSIPGAMLGGEEVMLIRKLADSIEKIFRWFDKERKIVRPLLPFKKQDLLEYTTANSLGYVEDSSNSSNKYTRNNFRNQIIPLVKEHFPAAEENLLNNIQRLNEVELIYNDAIEKLKKSLIEAKNNELHIPILKLKKSQPLYTIIWEIVKDFGFAATQVNEIIKLLDASNGSYLQSASHRIINNRGKSFVFCYRYY